MVTLVGSPTLSREPPDHPAVDFAVLKSEAIGWLQRFAGEGWTDYNAHDPGVTILEQLCYALTDLGYRAGFPVRDLLARPDGAIGSASFGPHPPWRTLPTQPVTVNDFRRLLLDRVSGVANIWIDPRTPDPGQPADGLHDIRVQAAEKLPGIRGEPNSARARVAERVRRMFLHHRPLCEDIGSVRVLRPLRTVVTAILHLDGTIRPEIVAAEAIYRLALTLAPEPKRIDLSDLPPDTAPSRLFDGPLALNGFVPTGELSDQRRSVAVADLVERLVDMPGVLSVRDAGLWVEGVGACADGACEIDRDHVFMLDAGLDPERDPGGLPLVLVSGGRVCPVNSHEVIRELRRLWANHRRRYPLKSGYRARFPAPEGRPRDLGRFTPLAAQFPAVYRLGDGSAPPATPAAAQLLGFLSIFEMIMIDYCDRLDGLAGLLAGDPPDDVEAGSEALRARIPALAHLAPQDPPIPGFAPMRLPLAQQEELLDLLLALYGEEAETIPLFPPMPPGSEAARRRRIAVKRALLASAVPLGRRRGRGYDYRSGPDSRRVAGAELRTRLLLGEPPLAQAGERARLAFVEHMMLRPRTPERIACERGAFHYGLGLSVVVDLPPDAIEDREYRRQIGEIVREAVPAHIGVHLHVVERERWHQFHRLHRLWRMSLQLGELPAVDWASAQLREMLHLWSEGDAA